MKLSKMKFQCRLTSAVSTLNAVAVTKTLTVAAALSLLAASAFAYDADWKRGRVYYRSVCTSCHAAQPSGQISPSTRTKAEWTAYLQADRHAKSKGTVKQYVSKAYRASIKSGNKAAEKFADTPDQELAEDIKAFLVKGAKDGDAPATCS